MHHEDDQHPEKRPPEDPSHDAGHESPRRDENWLEERYPLVDADFVGDTLDRVLRDQSEIAAEAARVDEFQFDERDLAELSVPTPDPDFVDRTLRKALEQRRAGLWSADASEHDFQDLLLAHQPPAPSSEFVDRTLAAVIADRGATAGAGSRRPAEIHRPDWRRPFSIIASVAALILCGIALFWPGETPAPVISGTPASFAALITDSAGPAPTFGSREISPEEFADGDFVPRTSDALAYFTSDFEETR